MQSGPPMKSAESVILAGALMENIVCLQRWLLGGKAAISPKTPVAEPVL